MSDGKLELKKYMCLTCRKPFKAWFAQTPLVKGECTSCYLKRTSPKRKRRR